MSTTLPPGHVPLSTLRSAVMHNSQQSVYRLPPEAVCLIFDEYRTIANDEHFGRSPSLPELTSWCKGWRDIALDYRALWSSICISTGNGERAAPHFIVFRVPSRIVTLDALDSVLKRSGLLIDVYINLFRYPRIQPNFIPDTVSMLHNVRTYSPRFRSLKFTGAVDFRFFPIRSPMPHLDSLDLQDTCAGDPIHARPDWTTTSLIRFVPRPWGSTVSTASPPFATSNLSRITLNHRCLDAVEKSYPFLDLRSLSSLDVTVRPVRQHGELLMRLLIRARNLQTLSIVISSALDAYETPPRHALLSLTRLTSLHFRFGNQAWCGWIPNHFDSPELRHLDVDDEVVGRPALDGDHSSHNLVKLVSRSASLLSLHLPWRSAERDGMRLIDIRRCITNKRQLVVFNISIDSLISYCEELVVGLSRDAMPELRYVIIEPLESDHGPVGWREVCRRILDAHSHVTLVSHLEIEVDGAFEHDRFLAVRGSRATSLALYETLQTGEGNVEVWLAD